MRTKSFVVALVALVAGGLAAEGIAGCGSSSKAPGVQLAPSSGSTEASVPTTPKPPPALAKKPTVVVPAGPAPTKLIIRDLVVGTGQTAKVGDTVTVNYVGVLFKGGTEFDSSWKTGRPPTIPPDSPLVFVVDLLSDS